MGVTYMGLTRHEKEIVSRINKGEIFDIPSYLRSFGKGHDQTYDMNAPPDHGIVPTKLSLRGAKRRGNLL